MKVKITDLKTFFFDFVVKFLNIYNYTIFTYFNPHISRYFNFQFSRCNGTQRLNL